MESSLTTKRLRALGHETRWAIYQLLIENGSEGLSAGVIGETLQLPPATLSFHLRELSHAALIGARQLGRFIYYSADSRIMEQLLEELARCSRGSPLRSAEHGPENPSGASSGSSGAKPTVRPKSRPV